MTRDTFRMDDEYVISDQRRMEHILGRLEYSHTRMLYLELVSPVPDTVCPCDCVSHGIFILSPIRLEMTKYTYRRRVTIMGIRGLAQLLAEMCADAIKQVPLSELGGWTVAVDGNLMVNQMLRVGARIVNNRGESIHHLQGSLWRLLTAMEAGIKPVVVFDGKPPALKGRVLAARKEARGDEAPKVTSDHYTQLQHLLRLMGIAMLQAAGEAEAAAARMRVDAVATDDLDALVFGAKVVIKGLSSEDRVTLIRREDVLKCLGLTQSQFIDMCMLCGGDYLVNIPDVGAKRALGLIKTYGSFEKVLTAIAEGTLGYKLPAEYPWKEARELYVNPMIGGESERAHKPNVLAVQEFLVGRGLDVSRVAGAVKRLEALGGRKPKTDTVEDPKPKKDEDAKPKAKPTDPPKEPPAPRRKVAHMRGPK